MMQPDTPISHKLKPTKLSPYNNIWIKCDCGFEYEGSRHSVIQAIIDHIRIVVSQRGDVSFTPFDGCHQQAAKFFMAGMDYE